MERDMERQGGKRRQEEKEDSNDACNLGVDAETESCPQETRKELEANISIEPRDVISQLPELSQDKVFSFLGVKDKVQAAQVSSSWQDAVYRPCQWREVKVTLDLGELSEEDMSSLQQRKIRHLEVETFDVQSTLVDRLHGCLVSLDLSSNALPVSVLQQVFCKRFISLKKLCVYIDGTEPLVFQKVQDVFQYLSNLEDLDLTVDKCGNDVVEAVGRHLKSLKDFSLTASYHAACNLEFLCHLSRLQSLFLRQVNLSGIDHLKSSCQTMKKVSFEFCNFDTAGWPEVVSQMPSLEELLLSSCTPTTDDGLRQVTEGQRNLKVLKYVPYCPSPFVIDLGSLARMPNLEDFSVGSGRFESDDDFEALSSGFKNLRTMAIWNCLNVSPAFAKGIGGLSSLQELSLSSLDVDGTSLEMISKGSCQLRTLKLGNCYSTNGEDMKHVAGMSSLRELALSDMNLGSTGLDYLKQGSLSLETLTLERCGWTFRDVKPWLEKQHSLQCLKIWHFSMTEAERTEADNLKEVLPFLTTVDVF